MKHPKMAEMDEYEVKHCAEKVIEVEEYKQDPKKWEAIQKEIKKKKKAINSIDDLRAKAQEMDD